MILDDILYYFTYLLLILIILSIGFLRQELIAIRKTIHEQSCIIISQSKNCNIKD